MLAVTPAHIFYYTANRFTATAIYLGKLCELTPSSTLIKGALWELDIPDLQREIEGNVNMIKGERGVSNKSVGTLLLLRSGITRANFRLAKLEKAEFTYRK